MKDEQRPEGDIGDVGPVEDFKVTVPPVGVMLAINASVSKVLHNVEVGEVKKDVC